MANPTRPRRDRDSSTANKPKPRADAYVGILAISLLLQIAAGIFLYLDYNQYPTTTPPKPGATLNVSASPLTPGGPVAAPGAGGAGAAGGAEKAGGAP
jgi:hypothetical protein